MAKRSCVRLFILSCICAILDTQIGTVRSQNQSEYDDVDSLFPSIIQLERENFQEPANDYSARSVFDFIVVGAGAAGCTVASRLSEIDFWDVLLLEAGPEETFAMDIPYFSGSGRAVNDWNYTSYPQHFGGCPSGPNASCPYPRGRVMGGSTSVNLMLFMRGNRRDYDNWAELGNVGWSYDQVLPYFKKMENVQIPQLRNSPYHGTHGNIMNSQPQETEFTNMTLEAARELDIPEVDYNGANQTGISHIQSTTFRGIRWSANRGYLFPAHTRRNLFVRKMVLVSKVIIEHGRAVGVEYYRDGMWHTAYAKKEVILSAGSINTPQILMLSGVGPKEHLQQFGIPVVQDLPVGRGMQDHAMFLGLIMVVNDTILQTRIQSSTDFGNYLSYFFNRSGTFTSTRSVEIFRFTEVGEEALNSSWTNMEMFTFTQPAIKRQETAYAYGFNSEFYDRFVTPLLGLYSFQPVVLHLRPRSKGYVNLTSDSIFSQPLINPRYFSDERDVQEAVQGVKEAIQLFTTGPFRELGSQVYNKSIPYCEEYEFMSDEYWACAVRWASATIYHPCGTCRMGPSWDKQAVVTPDLKVKGIRNLRVIDASVMPVIPAAHLQVPTYMVGEKGADLVKQDYLR